LDRVPGASHPVAAALDADRYNSLDRSYEYAYYQQQRLMFTDHPLKLKLQKENGG
jgi:hypothetical protein